METNSLEDPEYIDLQTYLEDIYVLDPPFDKVDKFLRHPEVSILGRQVRRIARGLSLDIKSDIDVIVSSTVFNEYTQSSFSMISSPQRRKLKFKWSDITIDCIVVPVNFEAMCENIVFSSLFSVEHAFLYKGQLKINSSIFQNYQQWYNLVLERKTKVVDLRTQHYFNDRAGQVKHAIKMHRKGWTF